MDLTIQYRGSLTSCNYACNYCPFAKRQETARQLQRDRREVARFTDWVCDQSDHHWRVMFTPWGEALVRAWYRTAVTKLTRAPHVAAVSVQTNLSCPLDWISQCQPERLALWATYHPSEVERRVFLRKVLQVRERGVRLSVGVVGVPEVLEGIVALRRELPHDVYLWINPQQPRRRAYTADQRAQFTTIDPQFPWAERRYESRGQPCLAGEIAFTVNGSGDMRRCHFVDPVIGNIYQPGWPAALQARTCPNAHCDCFLGKAQAQHSQLRPFFGPHVLERIPPSFVSEQVRDLAAARFS